MHKAKDYLKHCIPGGDQYIILPEMLEKETEYKIVYADDNKSEERTQMGEIVARGPGRMPDNGTTYQPMQYDIGDRVVFKKFAGDDMYFDENLKIHPGHHDGREGWLYVKVLRQDSILYSFPHEAPQLPL